ncbi:BnaC02g44240D [Brassica napus]|uniref:BnaC02g44240D protein n=1 Tax=Brassica napus TaxID=3708 RepID=A0A078JF05_BRANA|nr:BnaC02g44240D [Brassica napus]
MLIAEAIEQKKVQEQPHVEQDTAFSTRPSPARPVSAKKPVGARASNGGANGTPNRRLSLNANQNGSRSVVKEGGRSVCNFAIVNLKIS